MNDKLLDKYIKLLTASYGLSNMTCGRVNLDTAEFITTRDGRTILDWCRQLPANDEEVLLQSLLSTVSKQMEKLVGDGTTTAMLQLLYLLKCKNTNKTRFTIPTAEDIGTKVKSEDIVKLLSKTTHNSDIIRCLDKYENDLKIMFNNKHKLKFIKHTSSHISSGILLEHVSTKLTKGFYHIFSSNNTFEDYTVAAKISELLKKGEQCLVIAPNINYNIEQSFINETGHGSFNYIKYDTVDSQKKLNYDSLSNINFAGVTQTNRGLLIDAGGVDQYAFATTNEFYDDNCNNKTVVCFVETDMDDFEFASNVDDLETFYTYLLNNEVFITNAATVYADLKYDILVTYAFMEKVAVKEGELLLQVCDNMQKLAAKENNNICANTIVESLKLAVGVYKSYIRAKNILYYKPNNN